MPKVRCDINPSSMVGSVGGLAVLRAEPRAPEKKRAKKPYDDYLKRVERERKEMELQRDKDEVKAERERKRELKQQQKEQARLEREAAKARDKELRRIGQKLKGERPEC